MSNFIDGVGQSMRSKSCEPTPELRLARLLLCADTTSSMNLRSSNDSHVIGKATRTCDGEAPSMAGGMTGDGTRTSCSSRSNAKPAAEHGSHEVHGQVVLTSVRARTALVTHPSPVGPLTVPALCVKVAHVGEQVHQRVN